MRKKNEVKKSEGQSQKENQIRTVQSEQLCVATTVICSYMVWGAVFGARVVGVVSETDE